MLGDFRTNYIFILFQQDFGMKEEKRVIFLDVVALVFKQFTDCGTRAAAKIQSKVVLIEIFDHAANDWSNKALVVWVVGVIIVLEISLFFFFRA